MHLILTLAGSYQSNDVSSVRECKVKWCYIVCMREIEISPEWIKRKWMPPKNVSHLLPHDSPPLPKSKHIFLPLLKLHFFPSTI